jgi:hypothetical protein
MTTTHDHNASETLALPDSHGYILFKKSPNLCISKAKYDAAGEARRIIFGFYLICDP